MYSFVSITEFPATIFSLAGDIFSSSLFLLLSLIILLLLLLFAAYPIRLSTWTILFPAVISILVSAAHSSPPPCPSQRHPVYLFSPSHSFANLRFIVASLDSVSDNPLLTPLVLLSFHWTRSSSPALNWQTSLRVTGQQQGTQPNQHPSNARRVLRCFIVRYSTVPFNLKSPLYWTE